MTIEELNSVLDLKKQIETEISKLADLKLCSGVSSSKVSAVPKTQALTSMTEKIVVKISEAEARISRLEDKLAEAQAELVTKLTAALSGKSALWASVLVRHYCAGLAFNVIARQLNFTVDYIHFLHRQAKTFVTNGEWRPSRRRERR